MGRDLDLDDVVAQYPEAKRELAQLKEDLAAARALLEETQSHRTDERGFVRWYSLWCSRVDAALAEGEK